MQPYDEQLGAYSRALGSVESSNNYRSLGPVVKKGSYAGDRAYGYHQVMGRNIPEWTQAALGRSLTPDEFLNDPSAQDAVFKHRFGGYLAKGYSPQDAASMWFTGRPLSQGGNASDGYITGNQYVDRFNKALGNPPMATAFAGNPQQAPMATPIQSAMTVAGPAKRQPPPPQQDQGILQQIMSGGPGALIGAPDGVFRREDGSPGYDLGNSLQGAGAWLTSIADPKGGASLLAAQAAQNSKDHYGVTYDKDTGMFTRIDNRTGAVSQFANPAYQGRDLPGDVLKEVANRNDAQNTLHSVGKLATQVVKDLDAGDLDPSLLGRGQAYFEQTFGKGSKQSQAYARYEQLLNQKVLLEQLAQKGPQTEADAARMFSAFLGGTTRYDPEVIRNSVHDMMEKSREAHKDFRTYLDAVRASTNNERATAPYYERAGSRDSMFSDYDTYRRSRAQPQQAAPAAQRARPSLNDIFR